MKIKEIEKPLSILMLVTIIWLTYMIIKPFLIPIVWGAFIAFATWPAHTWLSKKIGSKTLSASAFSLVMVTLIIVPFMVIGMTIANDGKELIHSITSITHKPLPNLPEWAIKIPMAGEYFAESWKTWQSKGDQWFSDAIPYVQEYASFILGGSGGIANGIAQIAMAILCAFVFYVHGKSIAETVRQALSKIIGTSSAHYWKIAADTIQNVMNGLVGTALAQGVVASIGFLIAGVPGAILLGVLTFLVSVIPLAPVLIWLPAAGWLFIEGETGYATFMMIWGLIVISGVDNIVKPLLISRGSVMPLSVILVGVVGGMIAFGFLGMFVGPVVLALFFTLLREWLSNRALREA